MLSKNFAILFFVSAVAGAQPRSSASCWLRPAPQAQCGGYLVTEAAAEFPLLKPTENDFRARFTLGGGYMQNVSAQGAVGAVVAWDVARGWSRPARGELRYRRWLDNTMAADFGIGLAQRGAPSTITPGSPGGGTVRAYGLTTMTGVEWRYVALDLRGEIIKGGGQDFSQVFVGGRATSAAAPVAVLIGLGLIVAVVSRSGY